VDNNNGYVLLKRSQFSQVILMDEPALPWPDFYLRIEELLQELKQGYHHRHPQYATGITVSDMTAFSTSSRQKKGGRILSEYDKTEKIFQTPQQQATQEYVSGR